MEKSQSSGSLLHFHKLIVKWRGKKQICFQLAGAPDKLDEVSYFDDSKSSMQVEGRKEEGEMGGGGVKLQILGKKTPQVHLIIIRE